MSDMVTAVDMATGAGIDPKRFRHELRKAGFKWHVHNAAWKVERDSPKHRDMQRVLQNMRHG